MGNTHIEDSTPTSTNVTVRPPKPRSYLTEREVEKLIDAAGKNRQGHRDATAILLAFRHLKSAWFRVGTNMPGPIIVSAAPIRAIMSSLVSPTAWEKNPIEVA
jgi:hypothetical protein